MWGAYTYMYTSYKYYILILYIKSISIYKLHFNRMLNTDVTTKYIQFIPSHINIALHTDVQANKQAGTNATCIQKEENQTV